MIFDYIKARLLEPSTWRWVVGLAAGAIGVTLTDAQTATIVAWIIGIVGGLAVLTPDKVGK